MIMSLKHLVHKAAKSIRKHLRRLPRSFDLRKGHGKASAFNPITHPVFQLRKLRRGLTRGSTLRKVSRALGQKSSGVLPYQYSLGGSSGTSYVHDAKSLSQLTGGR